MHRRHIEARARRTQLRWVVARPDGDAVQFNERSRVDQSGKAKIIPDGSGVGRGVFFELSEGGVSATGLVRGRIFTTDQ